MSTSEMIDVLKPNDYDENMEKYRKISVVVVSDTHNKHQTIQIPDGDIFLHCGDFTNRHDWQNFSDDHKIPQSILNFNQWLGSLPHRHKIVICGNHEIGFNQLSKETIQRDYLTNCFLTIYGCRWPFNNLYDAEWSSIPSQIDILMTHLPPQFILDLAYQPKKSSDKPCPKCNNCVHGSYGHWGSQTLINEIRQRIKPRVHCFGHVHDDFGYQYEQDENKILFINAAADITRQTIQFHFYINLQNDQ